MKIWKKEWRTWRRRRRRCVTQPTFFVCFLQLNRRYCTPRARESQKKEEILPLSFLIDIVTTELNVGFMIWMIFFYKLQCGFHSRMFKLNTTNNIFYTDMKQGSNLILNSISPQCFLNFIFSWFPSLTWNSISCRRPFSFFSFFFSACLLP